MIHDKMPDDLKEQARILVAEVKKVGDAYAIMLIGTALTMERERCAVIARDYKRDASFDDSQVNSIEYQANQENIFRAILGLDKPLTRQ